MHGLSEGEQAEHWDAALSPPPGCGSHVTTAQAPATTARVTLAATFSCPRGTEPLDCEPIQTLPKVALVRYFCYSPKN